MVDIIPGLGELGVTGDSLGHREGDVLFDHVCYGSVSYGMGIGSETLFIPSVLYNLVNTAFGESFAVRGRKQGHFRAIQTRHFEGIYIEAQ